jgi:hypothetical protein
MMMIRSRHHRPASLPSQHYPGSEVDVSVQGNEAREGIAGRECDTYSWMSLTRGGPEGGTMQGVGDNDMKKAVFYLSAVGTSAGRGDRGVAESVTAG